MGDINYEELNDVQVAGIDPRDAPDFCDAYIESACIGDRACTEAELEILNDDSDLIHGYVQARIYG